jgi:hypothetical protein
MRGCMDGSALTVPGSQSVVSSKSLAAVWLPRGLILVAIGIVVIYAGMLGVRFRHWVWDATVPIRFLPDIDRGYDWGRKCATEGYLNQYEKMQAEKPKDEDWLDYAPLRLGVMAMWGDWSLKHFPDVKTWHSNHSYALTAPVLHFNMLMEIIGVVSAFFLTRLWAIRGSDGLAMDRDSVRWFFRGWGPGLSAAALLWFNPAIVLSAYGWPTWDLWIIPMFLLAALFASLDWWFAAGVAVGIGAMFKGQQFITLPVFLIWAIMLGRPLGALRFCCGVVMAVGLVVLPWMVTHIPADVLAQRREAMPKEPWQTPAGVFQIFRVVDGPAIIWVLSVLAASIAMPFVSWLTLEIPAEMKTVPRWRKIFAARWAWEMIAAFTTFALVVWPWLLNRNLDRWWVGVEAAGAMVAAVLFVRPRGIAYLAAGAMGSALLLCMSVFHGSTAWYDCGLHFGTVHWPKLITGLTDNLPGILQHDFNWPGEDISITVFTIPTGWLGRLPYVVSMWKFLQILFWSTLLLCSIGVGMHARRRDGRILIALTGPWLMFFCFPAQIHERYLLFAAGVSCICAGVSVGMTLLGMFLSAVTFAMTLHCMLVGALPGNQLAFVQRLGRQFPGWFNENTGNQLLRVLNGTHPDLGYAVILCALIFLYFSIAPRRRNRVGT